MNLSPIQLRMMLLMLLMTVASTEAAVLNRSDVVLMYQASPDVYQAYGATVLAWGGKPTPKSLEESKGVKFFGSVGMVTEFPRYYERFPQTYQQGLCRDVNGQPVKVPWLTDHQHKGVPYWWCCTQQPQFRQYLRERVIETVKAGADGVHVDDHLGTSGGLWLGLCFCNRCLEGFRLFLKSVPTVELQAYRLGELENFDYQSVVKQWLSEGPSRKPTEHPLWPLFTVYQCRSAAAFMQELRQLAAETVGHTVPMGANAGLLWPRHLVDYPSLDLFSAETDHQAEKQRSTDLPLFAYRLADAVQRPYAATASGGDWAYIQEHHLPGLVCGWIALAYAAGHCLMAPNRQWCYTPEKGTHWFQGPAEKYAPLYQFVRHQAALFDGYEALADVGVILPHRAFVRNPNRWFDLCQQLASKNISYRLLLGGDELVDHPLSAGELNACPLLLVVQPDDLLPADRQMLQRCSQPILANVNEAIAAARPAVRVANEVPVRVLPRVKPGLAVVHLLNHRYDARRDAVEPLEHVRLKVDLKGLGIDTATECRFVALDGARPLPLRDGQVEVPLLGLWGILQFGSEPSR